MSNDENDLISRVTSLTLNESRDKSKTHGLRTGFAYHEPMVNHRCLWDDNYEESPKRFTRTLNRMKELQLIERCELITPRKATEEEILSVHTKEYYDTVKSTDGVNDEDFLESLSSKYDAVYFHPETYELALYSAGCVIDLVNSIVVGDLNNGFALVRPPGHHAMAGDACGYCIFNNVAIAASHAINKLGLKRVLIVDWDVHHGQATQYTFYDDPRVLYFSAHRYEYGTFWPNLIESNYNFIGGDNAKGFNINVPLNEIGMENGDYLSIFYNILLPVAYEYDPELIIVSAGYDAAIGCPEGEMRLSPACYAHLCHSLMSLANGKVCVVIEGGYCLKSLAESAALTLRTLLGDPCPSIGDILPLKSTLITSILDVIWAQRQYWKCLKLQGTFDRHSEDTDDISGRKRHLPIIEYKGDAGFTVKPEKYPTRECYPMQSDDVKVKLDLEIQKLIDTTSLDIKHSRDVTTVIVYDDIMTEHRCTLSHPERPERVKAIMSKLKSDNLYERCYHTKSRFATDEELMMIHTEEHIKRIKGLEEKSNDILEKMAENYDSIYFHKNTYKSATIACGSLLQIVDHIMKGEYLNGFGCIRPPGHHADRKIPAGFCMFNNVAIAAKYAIKKYGVKRILIVDWDVHHGDGTQKIYENDDRVLYVSLHRYDYAQFYPSTVISGVNRGKNIINIPWNGGPMFDSEYLMAFLNIIMPVAYQFNPELVFVSCGFDSASGDPLGEYELSSECYGHFTHFLKSLANGKLILALEGGYNLKSISSSAAKCVSVLTGESPSRLKLKSLNEEAIETLKTVMQYHSTNWDILQFNADIPENNL